MKVCEIELEIKENKIAILWLDTPDSGANVLNSAAFENLHHALDRAEKVDDLKGLVFASRKDKIFIAGADLSELAKGPDVTDDVLDNLIRMGQDAFNRIEALPFTTVAAIHGACVGGGYELTLACDYRIASHHKSTRIGLPEVNLGILPAWGGCTRLPRLIGLQKAASIILAGKIVRPQKARKLGMVDAVCHPKNLVTQAALYAQKAKATWPAHRLEHVALVPELIHRIARRDILSRTLGNYPAPLRALDVMTKGFNDAMSTALNREREAILELMQTDVARNLMHVFFLQEKAKKRTWTVSAERPHVESPIGHTSVVGAGVMGAGIAHWLSTRGHTVLLRDIQREFLAKGMQVIRKRYDEAVKRRILTKEQARDGMDRVTPRAHDVPMAHIDLVIEAIIEKMPVKKQLFAQLEAQCASDTILATNTSALSISEMAQDLQHPERVVGIHFFNPVHRMQLVEIVRGKQTSDLTMKRTLDWVKRIGKLPIIVNDGPGFLVNRILMPYLMEAVYLFRNGVKAELLDSVMQKFGMPMGPLRLIDEVGIDVAKHVGMDLALRLDYLPAESELLDEMMEKKMIGRKTGKGFYIYDSKGEPKVNTDLDRMRVSTECIHWGEEEIEERLVLLMINEAARCMDAGVVESPHDVDLGMIMGTGWAPFRGGPLKYADKMGAAHIVKRLKTYADEGDHYEPAKCLMRMVDSQGKFYENT